MASKQFDMTPWKSIWLEPRKTIRSIVRTNPKAQFWLLSWLYAFPVLLHMAQSLSLGEVFPIALIVLISAGLAAFVGWASLSILAYILLWTGRWIGGDATFLELRAAVAWANVPNVVNIILWVLLTIEFGALLFTTGFSEMEFMGYQLGLVVVVFILQLTVAVWSFIILIKTIAEVQGFSAWKALLNIFMPLILVLAASYVLAWIVWSIHALVQ